MNYDDLKSVTVFVPLAGGELSVYQPPEEEGGPTLLAFTVALNPGMQTLKEFIPFIEPGDEIRLSDGVRASRPSSARAEVMTHDEKVFSTGANQQWTPKVKTEAEIEMDRKLEKSLQSERRIKASEGRIAKMVTQIEMATEGNQHAEDEPEIETETTPPEDNDAGKAGEGASGEEPGEDTQENEEGKV